MKNKSIKTLAMALTALSATSAAYTTLAASTPAVQDDLVQDAGSWAQVVGEGSLKAVDPKLDKVRIWLE